MTHSWGKNINSICLSVHLYFQISTFFKALIYYINIHLDCFCINNSCVNNLGKIYLTSAGYVALKSGKNAACRPVNDI